MCEYDQRERGKRANELSANRTILSGGGGDPTIQPIVTGSLLIASRRARSSAIVARILLPARHVCGVQCGAGASILEPIGRMARTAKRSPARRAKFAVSWATVREMGMALPGVEEGTTYGTPALKVRGRMFACVPSNRAAEPDSLVLRLSFDARDELIEAEPATY